jgi:hypothetical protein
MSPQSDDGLAALTNRREQAVRQRRRVPPPHHHKPDGDASGAGPATTAGPKMAPQGSPAAAFRPASPVPSSSAPATVPVQRPRRPTAEAAGVGETRLAQFYVNEQIDEWLEDIRGVAVVERVNLSASAVVRHILSEYMQHHPAHEVVRELGQPKPPRRRQRP